MPFYRGTSQSLHNEEPPVSVGKKNVCIWVCMCVQNPRCFAKPLPYRSFIDTYIHMYAHLVIFTTDT